MPGLSRSSLIVNLSHFRKLVYLKSLKFPFLTARDVVLLGYGDVYSVRGHACERGNAAMRMHMSVCVWPYERVSLPCVRAKVRARQVHVLAIRTRTCAGGFSHGLPRLRRRDGRLEL